MSIEKQRWFAGEGTRYGKWGDTYARLVGPGKDVQAHVIEDGIEREVPKEDDTLNQIAAYGEAVTAEEYDNAK